MPSRFDSAPPKSAVSSKLTLSFSTNLFHPRSCRRLFFRTIFKTLSWSLEIYTPNITDFQWNWFCTHLFFTGLSGWDVNLTILLFFLRHYFPSSSFFLCLFFVLAISWRCPNLLSIFFSSFKYEKRVRKSYLARMLNIPCWSHRGTRERSI